MKTGNTHGRAVSDAVPAWPQWSPVMKTGNTFPAITATSYSDQPQWSPVMKTGNTRQRLHLGTRRQGLNGARS